MKADRRWYNDGRLEREIEAAKAGERKQATGAEADRLRLLALGWFPGADVEVYEAGPVYNVVAKARGARLRVTLNDQGVSAALDAAKGPR